jgi:hypothetical protein
MEAYDIELIEEINRANALVWLGVDGAISVAVMFVDVSVFCDKIYERMVAQVVERGGGICYLYGYRANNSDTEILRYLSLDAMKDGIDDPVVKGWLQ